jgi:hypothetical protein
MTADSSTCYTVGTLSAFGGDVKFYGILQGGFQTPLAAIQITGLFDNGCLSRDARSESAERTELQTIEELFPHLQSTPSRPLSRRSPAARTPFCLSLPAAIALVPVGMLATVVIGYLFFGAQPSVASPVVPSAMSLTSLSSQVRAKQQTKKSNPQRRSSSPGTQIAIGSRTR